MSKKEEQKKEEQKEEKVIIKSMSEKENIELLDIVGSDDSNATKVEKMIFKGVDACLNGLITEFFKEKLETEVSEIVNEDSLKIRMSLVADESKSMIFNAPEEMVAEYRQGKEMQKKKRDKAVKAQSAKAEKSTIDLIKEMIKDDKTPSETPEQPKAENG